MASKVVRALNPFNWFSSSRKSYEEDRENSEEVYENPAHSPWKDRRKLKDEERRERKDLKDEESEIFRQQHLDSQLLDTQYKRKDVKWDVKKRENDLSKLQIQVRNHWESYKHWLEQASEEGGMDEIEAKTKAKQAKKAAKDKEQLYKVLWKELDALKNSLRKDEQIRILSGGGSYQVSFADIDSASAEKAAEQHSNVLRKRKMMVNQFKKGVSRTDEEVEIDFSDIERDVAELEMDDMGDFDVYFEEQGEGEIPEQAPEVDGDEWS